MCNHVEDISQSNIHNQSFYFIEDSSLAIIIIIKFTAENWKILNASVIAYFNFKESNENSKGNNRQLLMGFCFVFFLSFCETYHGHIPNFSQTANEEGNLHGGGHPVLTAYFSAKK